MIAARGLFVCVLLAAILAFILSRGTSSASKKVWFNDSEGLGVPKIPDFSHYQLARTLSSDEFPLDSPDRRVILVGDIHGMYKPFSTLLHKVDYSPDTDVLIHTGDFLSKGLHHQSIETLGFMALHNVTGVRGNHDQQIIEWRGWINWICSTTDGCDWLRRTEHNWKHMHDRKSFDLNDFLQFQQNSGSHQDRQWWKLIPAGWKFLSDHYRIAREMTKEQYDYLLNLPLALYIPSAHTFVVHAGLLPSDPRYPYYDKSRQPLARIPRASINGKTRPPCEGNLMCIDHLRQMQEESILQKVPQNKDPWVLMNMRSVKNGKVFRKYTGVYWTKLWNKEMGLCAGYDGASTLNDSEGGDDHQGSLKRPRLPCYPSTVVYGHSASQGFHPKKWSIGLDSGCVYGRSLTALVLDGHETNEVTNAIEDDDNEDEDDISPIDADGHDDDENADDGRVDSKKRRKGKKTRGTISFSDHHKAKVVSVRCH